ncbi:alpha-E domain-containing protein [Euzebya rosea]|uniref:alpha-E domain-containing protein n=1 Tax=Euzebya rosea TaxID=2052804 RepID=UPI000D3E7E08|nr:alpha-E domain-containing protein [Euzebya rosea]
MLLSRLAENIYWAGRYLERAEDTARLVKVHTELYMDLPQATSMGWSPLLAVTGSGDAYDEHVRQNGDDSGLSEELRVVTFLTTSPDNPSSVLSCLDAARANLRSVRALLPRSGWEQVNHLHLWGRDTQGKAVPRRSRTEWAEDLIRKCQTVSGLLSGTMSHDESYRFLQVGRHLERADMTTRVLDVQAQVLLQQISTGNTYADVTWMSVLKSVSAMQMFRRVARAGVSGSRALNFLLTDREFPRSVAHCLVELDLRLRELPNSAPVITAVGDALIRLDRADLDVHLRAMAPADLHDFMDRLQTDIGHIHATASDTWFAPPPVSLPETEPAVATTEPAPAEPVVPESEGNGQQVQRQSQSSTRSVSTSA